jgi:hypothetical protein
MNKRDRVQRTPVDWARLQDHEAVFEAISRYENEKTPQHPTMGLRSTNSSSMSDFGSSRSSDGFSRSDQFLAGILEKFEGVSHPVSIAEE